MIKRVAFALAVIGLAGAFSRLASADKSPLRVAKQRQVELSAADIKACSKMAKDLDALNAELNRHDIPEVEFAPEDDLRKTEELLRANKISDSPAVRLMLSLREAANSCSMDSYTILARAWLANSLDFDARLNRVAYIVYHYISQHALKCRPEYRRQFGELVEEMKMHQPRAFERVQTSLAGASFLGLTEDSNLVLNRRFWLRRYNDQYAIINHIDYIRFGLTASRSVAGQIATMMKEDGAWDSFRPAGGWPGTATAAAKDALREYLFGPCEQYSKHFKPVLAPARLDSVVQKKGEPKPLLSYGLELTRAMANRLLCLHLVEIPKDELKLLVASLVELKKKDSPS